MQTNISHSDPISEIEHTLQSEGISQAAQLLQTYLDNNENADNGDSRLLNLQLQIFINQGRFEELDTLVDQAKSEDTVVQARLLAAKGILYNRKGDYRNSLVAFLKSESLINAGAHPDLWAQIQINIGTAFASLHHYKEGSDRYNLVLGNEDHLLQPRTRAILLHNLGNLYYASGDIELSIGSLTKAISLIENTDVGLATKSKILLERSKIKQGHTPDLVGLVVEEHSDIYPVYRFCQACVADDKSDKLKEAILLAEQRGDFLTQIESCQLLIQLQQSQGALEDALQTMRSLRAVEAKLRTIQEEARLVEQATRYDLAEKERAIKALETENALQREIVKRNELLEAANEELRQFAYVVSHDLKEPLRMIGSYAQLISLELGKDISEEQSEYFDFVNGGVERLNILLDGLSSYSTLKSLQESVSSIWLSEVVKTACDNLDFLIHEHEAEIQLEGDVEILGSKALLEILFQNLIQNAIKFRGESKPVIQIKQGLANSGKYIEVVDNGIGIAADQQERIFIIFQRLSRANEGSGMGLAICKKIAQLHEGKLFIKESKLREGTTFRIELPH